MIVGEKFVHKGVQYTVTSIPSPGIVKGLSDAPVETVNEPKACMPRPICIAEADIE